LFGEIWLTGENSRTCCRPGGSHRSNHADNIDRINAVWLQLALTAADLIAWTQTILLTGELVIALSSSPRPPSPSREPGVQLVAPAVVAERAYLGGPDTRPADQAALTAKINNTASRPVRP
jgi:hypothetical protein